MSNTIQKWEYDIERCKNKKFQEVVTRRGLEGWEFAWLWDEWFSQCVLFKRPIPSQPNKEDNE